MPGIFTGRPSSAPRGLPIALQLTQEEAIEVWQSWLVLNGWGKDMFITERDFIFVVSERQPGALVTILDRMEHIGVHFDNRPEAEWKQRVRRWLLSPKLITAVEDLRSLNV
jgi:hypothetical protein